MISLNTLAQALNQIEETYGTQACLDSCDAIYSDTYRYPESFTVQDDPELKSEMIAIVAEYLAIKAGVYTRPSTHYDDYDDREPIDQFVNVATDLVLNNIPFALLCNYKGESDGIALLEEVKHLRVYISKFNYK